MSRENVEVVKGIVEAVRRGDWDAALSAYDPAVELDHTRMPDGGMYHGPEGVRKFYGNWFSSWDEFEAKPERFIEVDDRVALLVEIRGRGRGSGIEVEMHAADIWTLRDGKVVRHVGYPDAAEALEELGMAD